MMDWQTRLAERRETFSECPDCVLTKPTKPGSVSFVSSPDGRFPNIAPGSVAIRDHLRRLAEGECLPVALVDSLADEDVSECHGLPDETLRAYVRALADTALREAGRIPQDETARGMCAGCGPVWLAPEVAAVAPTIGGWPRVLGCPWCHTKNRRSIPRPLVACGECKHFIRDTVNPDGGMGRCAVDRATLPNDPLYYPHASRQCERFSPS